MRFAVRIILFNLFFLALSLVACKTVFGQTEFSTYTKSEYKFEPNGFANVTNTVRIRNNKSEVSPESYLISFSEFSPQDFIAYEEGRVLNYRQQTEDTRSVYRVFFQQEDIGRNNEKSFLYNYKSDRLASKYEGGVEVIVPFIKKGGGENKSDVLVRTPLEFGNLSYSSEKPIEVRQDDKFNLFRFTSGPDSQENLYLSFGEFALYDFEVTYNLENPLNVTSYANIAVIPDTEYQTVYYEEITPKPENLFRDKDGNWIATMRFEPRQKLDMKTKGVVQVFPDSVRTFSYSEAYLESLLKSDKYWESDSPEIVLLTKTYDNVEKVYDYITNTFRYYWDRDIADARNSRKGALKALASPEMNVCTEFSDTFVAMTRAVGVPSRSIIGYGYTENQSMNPISITSDVLHSWAEYFDREEGVFKRVDPTWQNTSGNDYFSTFDTNHITFVTNGISSEKPYSPGTYKLGTKPSKNVEIQRAVSPRGRKSGSLEVSISKQFTLNPFLSLYTLRLKNSGGSALYNVNPRVFAGSNQVYSEDILQMLPGEETSFGFKVRINFMGIGTPPELTIKAGEKTITTEVNKVDSVKIQLIITLLISIFASFWAVTYYNLNFGKTSKGATVTQKKNVRK